MITACSQDSTSSGRVPAHPLFAPQGQDAGVLLYAHVEVAEVTQAEKTVRPPEVLHDKGLHAGNWSGV